MTSLRNGKTVGNERDTNESVDNEKNRQIDELIEMNKETRAMLAQMMELLKVSKGRIDVLGEQTMGLEQNQSNEEKPMKTRPEAICPQFKFYNVCYISQKC